MNFKKIDMSSYKRQSHFKYFNSLAYPYVGITANVDITALLNTIKERKLPFFLTFCYCAAQAANSVAELRQRIEGNDIIEFETCPTSHTVALQDGTYCYCDLNANMPFDQYLPYALSAQEAAKTAKTIAEEKNAAKDKIFVSTIPWLSYTAITQPVPMPADSNPRITWGRYFEANGKMLMPVSVLCNHALVDGVHISAFYKALDKAMAALV